MQFAGLSDPQIVVAAITGLCGVAVAVVTKLIDRKAEAAKTAVNSTSAEVGVVKDAMGGLQILAAEQRVEIDRLHAEIDRLEARDAQRERDLIEEKSVNVALSRLLDEMGKKDGTNN